MTTHTTTRIHLTIRDHARYWLAQRDPIALLFLALALIIAVALLRPHASPASVAAVPTPPLPIILIATAPAELPPTPVPAAAVSAVLPTARYVVAFASPDGAVLGPIPAPEASALIGRWGNGWVATRWEGATVWIRAADLGLNLADAAPAVAPQVIYQVVNQQPAAQPTLTSEERTAALVREFGSADITGGDALAAHQAREDAYADGSARADAIRDHPANEHIPDSSEMPCHCP